MDILTPAQRTHRMGLVRAKNTKPEMAVRRLVHELGYRYRLHGRSLPGRPDMVFASLRKVVFVHGCFWHRHSGCAKASTPKANVQFWLAKFRANRKRDRLIERRLIAVDWGVITIWECELREPAKLKRRLIRELGSVR